MRKSILSILLVACSAAPAAKTGEPQTASATPVIRCDGGRELDFSRQLPSGDISTLSIQCTNDRVTVSASTLRIGPADLDAAPVVRETGTAYVDRSLFDRVWRGAFARADERGCNRRRGRATTSLTLRDTRAKREVTCFDLDATDIVAPMRAAVHLAPPVVAPNADVPWPYGGEYWKDELRYYSAR